MAIDFLRNNFKLQNVTKQEDRELYFQELDFWGLDPVNCKLQKILDSAPLSAPTPVQNVFQSERPLCLRTLILEGKVSIDSSLEIVHIVDDGGQRLEYHG